MYKLYYMQTLSSQNCVFTASGWTLSILGERCHLGLGSFSKNSKLFFNSVKVLNEWNFPKISGSSLMTLYSSTIVIRLAFNKSSSSKETSMLRSNLDLIRISWKNSKLKLCTVILFRPWNLSVIKFPISDLMISKYFEFLSLREGFHGNAV